MDGITLYEPFGGLVQVRSQCYAMAFVCTVIIIQIIQKRKNIYIYRHLHAWWQSIAFGSCCSRTRTSFVLQQSTTGAPFVWTSHMTLLTIYYRHVEVTLSSELL